MLRRASRRFCGSWRPAWSRYGEITRRLSETSAGEVSSVFPELQRPTVAVEPLDIPEKSPITPLAQELYKIILQRGPMTLAEFMRHCLTHPVHGYYVQNEVFGRGGDFVTSPEVSSVFSEMVGVWLVSTWTSLGSPSHCRLVELGPGRGTLMRDVLRTLRRFPACFSAISAVHLVEVSATMRVRQAETLGCVGVEGDEEGNVESAGKMGEDGDGAVMWLDVDKWGVKEGLKNREWGPVVQWHGGFEAIPADGALLCICHELFDALGVHQVEKGVDGKWREWLVDIDGFTPPKQPTSSTSPPAQIALGGPHHFRLVLSPGETPASRFFQVQRVSVETTEDEPDLETLQWEVGDGEGDSGERGGGENVEEVESGAGWKEIGGAGRLEDGAAGKRETTASLEDMLQQISKRLQEAKGEDGEGRDDVVEKSAANGGSWQARAEPGTRVEFSNKSAVLIQAIADRVVSGSGGAALVVDYGHDGARPATLRGIKDHEFVSFLQEPGLVDLSADVDFAALRDAANLVPGAFAWGPVTQSIFLQSLGFRERIEHLLQRDDVDHEALIKAAERLVHPDQMGSIYKVLAITTDALVDEPPLGGFQKS